jgi:hypothetical protein
MLLHTWTFCSNYPSILQQIIRLMPQYRWESRPDMIPAQHEVEKEQNNLQFQVKQVESLRCRYPILRSDWVHQDVRHRHAAVGCSYIRLEHLRVDALRCGSFQWPWWRGKPIRDIFHERAGNVSPHTSLALGTGFVALYSKVG